MTEALVLPSPRAEAWRWSDLSALPALAEAHPTKRQHDVSDLWVGADGPRLVFVDGQYRPEMSAPGPITLGPVVGGTDHALGRLAADRDGWVLALDAGSAAAGPIEIVHVATGGANHLPARVALAKGAQASLVETFVGDGWANRLTHVALAPEARLMRAIRLAQTAGFVSLRDEADVATGASLVTTILAVGAADTRLDAQLVAAGEGAFVEHGGAVLCRGQQRHDVAAVVHHAREGGASRQLWRAVADDRATAGLAARVEVARDAQRTDGEQSLRGLLLKRAATINLKPELEIFADDVKCAHGATVGELDRQALFYLASRGLAPDQAAALLTRAFVAEALARIGDEAVRAAFQKEAARWLGL